MTVINRQKIIEDAAKAIFDVRDDEFDLDEWEDIYPTERERYQCDARAILPVIVAAVLKPIREQAAEWREFMRDQDLTGYERSAIRMCASEMERLLDQIETDSKGR